MRVSIRLTALAGVAGVLLVGCGDGTPHHAQPLKSVVDAALKGSPPALASLHAQASRLLPGGPQALRARLAQVRGHPVVVNEWASWCEPCQAEFPVFQRAAVKYGRRVAFIGVDSTDSAANARAFLKRFPVSYPSYVDSSRSIDRMLQTIGGVPQTIYVNARGQHVYDHGGPYRTTASLEHDIRFYLLR